MPCRRREFCPPAQCGIGDGTFSRPGHEQSGGEAMSANDDNPVPEADVTTEPETSSSPEESDNGQPLLMLAPEDYPKLDHLITSDGKTVETFFAERMLRLL